jgi:hypothetical protein
MRKLILLFVFLEVNDAFACDCKSGSLRDLQAINFRSSELIAVVDVHDYDLDSGVMKAVVIEELKGEFTSDTLVILNLEYCAVQATLGRWLLYLTIGQTHDGAIIPVVDGCSISRSFRDPHYIGVDEYQPPPPPAPGTKPNEILSTEWETDLRERAHLDLMAEIRVLRSRL